MCRCLAQATSKTRASPHRERPLADRSTRTRRRSQRRRPPACGEARPEKALVHRRGCPPPWVCPSWRPRICHGAHATASGRPWPRLGRPSPRSGGPSPSWVAYSPHWVACSPAWGGWLPKLRWAVVRRSFGASTRLWWGAWSPGWVDGAARQVRCVVVRCTFGVAPGRLLGHLRLRTPDSGARTYGRAVLLPAAGVCGRARADVGRGGVVSNRSVSHGGETVRRLTRGPAGGRDETSGCWSDAHLGGVNPDSRSIAGRRTGWEAIGAEGSSRLSAPPRRGRPKGRGRGIGRWPRCHPEGGPMGCLSASDT